MSTITFFQIVLFTGYVSYIWQRFGVLSSISASSYALKGNERYIFFGWLLSLAVLNWYQDMGTFGWVMSLGFVLAGLTIEHKKSPTLEDEIHSSGTVLAILSGFGGLFILHGIWIPAAVMATGASLLYFTAINNWIWWVEILAMGSIAWGYLLR